MAAPLLYVPTQRWQIGVAFICATLLHFGAIAVAERQPKEILPMTMEDDGLDLQILPEIEDPTPPAMPDELVPPTMPPPLSDALIPEENSTPAPAQRVIDKPPKPLVRQVHQTGAGPLSMRAARVLALSAPRPEYPYEARRQRTTGSGVALLTIDSASGIVTDVAMAQTTGSAILDSATISGFRRWRFKPGTVAKVQSPITYTLTGSSY